MTQPHPDSPPAGDDAPPQARQPMTIPLAPGHTPKVALTLLMRGMEELYREAMVQLTSTTAAIGRIGSHSENHHNRVQEAMKIADARMADIQHYARLLEGEG